MSSHAVDQHVEEADEGRELSQQPARDGLASEPPFERFGRGRTVRRVGAASRHQHAVEDAVQPLHRPDDVREQGGKIVPRPAVKPAPAGFRDGLHAQAGPLPFGPMAGGVEVFVGRTVERSDRHERAEAGDCFRASCTAFQPGEERPIGRGLRVPDFLDGAEVPGEGGGERCSRQAGCYAARTAPGGKLRQRPANRRIGTVEPAGKQARCCRSRTPGKRRHRFGERRRGGRGPALRPDERDGLDRVADEIERKPQ